jgi:putative membrane protein
MKKSQSILAAGAIVLAGFLTFACTKTTETTATSDTVSNTNMATTDSSTTMSTSATDTTVTSTMTTPANSGTANATTSSLKAEDKEFVMKAAMGGMAEVAMGSDAATKGVNADVKQFGQTMATDHGKANEELKTLAAQKGVSLPMDIGKEHQEVIDKLAKKSGKDFDKAYMGDMVEDHEKDIKEFEKASKDAADPDVKAWATKTLPTLKHHLELAKAAYAKVK